MTRLTEQEMQELFSDPAPAGEVWESAHVRADRYQTALDAILRCESRDPQVLIVQAIAARGLGLTELADRLLSDAEDEIGCAFDGDR